ncbi:parapinopsin [Rothia dentocariosa]|uniref:parapinopsin n=1 Tax=Rothia dentocariosa TaxID=2047 RepID=UPI0028ED2A09|nr:parapinopsin [Rothia dentocariosa]
MRVRDCVYWGWGPFWALVVQVLIWWPIVGLVVRVAPSYPMVGPHLPFYVVLFSLPFVGIAVNFCLFRFLHPRRALGWMVPVAFGFMFLFGLFPMPFRGMSMLGFGSVVCGLYPGILLNNYYELYRVAKMSPEEVEEYQRELETREAEAQERELRTESTFTSFFFLLMVVVWDFMSVGIPTIHWKWYDPLPMFWQALVLSAVGMAVSVLVKRVLGWKVSGWVYVVLLVVSVVGVLWVWGYPVVLLAAPWWVGYVLGVPWVSAVEDVMRRGMARAQRLHSR